MTSFDFEQLGNLCKPKQWKTLSKADLAPSGYPVYGANGRIGFSDSFTHKHPTLLIGCRGSCGTVHITEPYSYANGNAMALDSLDTSRIDLKFLSHYLKHRGFSDVISGTSQPQIIQQNLVRINIPTPPLEEQRRIAAILDQADALRAKRREALAQLDSLTQSIFIEMFGKQLATTGHWPITQLSEISEILTGYAFRSEEYVGSSSNSLKLCRGANVMPGTLDWSDTVYWPSSKADDLQDFLLEEGDIVMAMDRPWISEGFKIARISKSDVPSLLVQRVSRLRGRNGVPSEFIFTLLKQPAFTRHCRPTETTIPHISPREVRNFEFRLPSLSLMNEFASRIRSVERLQLKQRSFLAGAEACFSSLQHRAFRGEL